MGIRGRTESGATRGHKVLFNLLTSLCYFLSALAGLYFSGAGSTASIIWPPAGISLAAVLMGRGSMRPGIFLGTFITTMYVRYDVQGILELKDVALSIVLSLGAVLQAEAGAWLIRRRIRTSHPLEQFSSVLRFVGLGGVAACVISSTIANTTLFITGDIAAEFIFMSWLTWWAGDAVGVAIFAPPLLLLCSKDLAVSNGRKLALASVLTLTVSGSILLSSNSRLSAQRTAETAFNQRCDEMKMSFESQSTIYEEMFLAVERWMLSHDFKVSHQQFIEFTSDFLKSKPEIKAIGWNPWIRSGERAAFEQALRDQGFPDYKITRRYADGSKGPAEPAPVHVPVAYIYPEAGNKAAHGHDTYALDPFSGMGRRDAIESARDSGNSRTTERISIVQDTGNRNAVLEFHPIYNQASPPGSIEERREHIKGFVVGVFYIHDMVNSLLDHYLKEGKELLVIDRDAPRSKQMLFNSSSSDQVSPGHLPELKPGQLEATKTIPFGGREWEFVIRETEEALAGRQGWLSVGILITGLCFSFLLNLMLLVVTGHTAHTERLITERTRELENTRDEVVKNAKLASLGMLAAGISHEINNPLAIIHAYAENLQRFTQSGKTDSARTLKATEMILTTAMRITKIIDGLKRYSRDESHSPCSDVKISDLLEDTLSLCREKFKSRGIALDTDCEFKVDLIFCRPTEITQVLVNLLNNSFHEIKESDEKWVRLDVRQENGFFEFAVTDSGPGIPEPVRARLFDPFFTTKETGVGTGLGLSISAGIIESHGGSIRVDATCPNTRFVFTLPVPTRVS